MKKCLNCNWDVRDSDKYCRNCGYPLQSNKSYVFTNVIIVFIVIGIMLMLMLFLSSYIVQRWQVKYYERRKKIRDL